MEVNKKDKNNEFKRMGMNKKIAITICVAGILLVFIGVVAMLGETYKTLGASNTLMKTSHEYEGQFWKYKEEIKSIVFEEKIDIPTDAIESWDVSESKNGTVMAYIKGNDSNELYYDLYIQGNDKIYANKDSSCLFTGFINVDYINNIELLDTSNVTNMSSMFSFMENLKSLNLSNFDTSKVTDMSDMFAHTGSLNPVFTLELGDNFDTSNVTNMHWMFYNTGEASTIFTLDLGDKFDTSKVTDMNNMFSGTGQSSTVFTLDLGDKFDTSNVVWMNGMFGMVGYKSPVFTLNLGNKFDTSKVIDMYGMFRFAGMKSTVFKLDCSNWNVSNVTKYKYFNEDVSDKVIAPKWVN